MALILPPQSFDVSRLLETWRYRDLLWIWVWRDIKVRYRQSAIGIGWAVVQPVVSMIVFSIVFGRLADLPSEGVPYPIFTFAAILPWQFFQRGLVQGSGSLIQSRPVLTKVYFPRVIAPLANILVALADFVIALSILLVLMIWYQVMPTSAILLLPLLVFHCLLVAMGVSLWFSAISIRFRDVVHALPFLAQMWMFATPVAYSMLVVPEQWRLLYALNPMVGVVEEFRWAILGTERAPDTMVLLISWTVTVVVLVSGLWFFTGRERRLADEG